MDMNTDALDRQDMAELVAGRDQALDRLMDRYGEKIFRFLLRTLPSEHDAAEIAHETFVRVYERKQQFKPEKRFSSWLFQIALNLARDRFRRIGRAKEVSLDTGLTEGGDALGGWARDDSADPSAALESRERGEIVRNAIEALPEELRLPVILAEYEGLSHSEIAEILDCSAKAVEMRIYRARKALRTSLKDVFSPTP